MKKKILSVFLALTLIMTSGVAVSAKEVSNVDVEQIQAENSASDIEDVVGTEDVNSNISEIPNEYIARTENSEIYMPKNGSGKVKINSSDRSEAIDISMGLPDAVKGIEGNFTKNGTIVYRGEKNTTISVQALSEKEQTIEVDSVRIMTTIENCKASHKYKYKYNLEEGQKLITSEEYYKDKNVEAEKGWIYIVDMNSEFTDENGVSWNELIGVIEPAWAIDANGKSINTHYSINNNELSQIVEFDNNSAFPIIADPKTSKRPQNKKISSEATTVKLNHEKLGLWSWVSSQGLLVASKKKIAKAVAKKIGSRFIPTIGGVIWVGSAYSTIMSTKGYKYTKVYIKYDVWRIYQHQGGGWAKGYQYKPTYWKINLVK